MKTTDLSANALGILRRVREVLQDCEELGGVSGTAEYLQIMRAVQALASERENAAIDATMRGALFDIVAVSANGNSDPDAMENALAEIQGIVRRTLETVR